MDGIGQQDQEVRGACPPEAGTALSSSGSSPVPGLAADALQSAGAAFTPGPWNVDPRYPMDVQADGQELATLISGSRIGQGIAFGGRSNISLDEAKANASLIAAAPKLHEALEDILPLVREALRSGIDDPSGPGSITGRLGYSYERALQALASVDTRRMAETGTGSGRSPSGAVAKPDALDPKGQQP